MTIKTPYPRLDKDTKAARDAFHARLAEAHPLAIVPYEMRSEGILPLKIGIGEDIAALYPDVPEVVRNACLVRWVNSKWYLRACFEPGTARRDLDGNAVGEITEAQAQHAKERLERKLERNRIRSLQKRQAAEQAT